jgi:IPT/TIG domain
MCAHSVCASFVACIQIRLLGEHFIPSVTFACRFGNDTVIATMVTAVEIVCPVPIVLKEGTVSVDISSDGVNWSPTGHNYTYYGSC